MYKGRVSALAQSIQNSTLRQVFNAIGLQLDEILSKIEDVEEDVKKIKKKIEDFEDE